MWQEFKSKRPVALGNNNCPRDIYKRISHSPPSRFIPCDKTSGVCARRTVEKWRFLADSRLDTTKTVQLRAHIAVYLNSLLTTKASLSGWPSMTSIAGAS